MTQTHLCPQKGFILDPNCSPTPLSDSVLTIITKYDKGD